MQCDGRSGSAGGGGMQRPPLLLLMLVAACRFAETYAEEFFQLRGRQDSLRYRGSHVDNHNIITSQEKAEVSGRRIFLRA